MSNASPVEGLRAILQPADPRRSAPVTSWLSRDAITPPPVSPDCCAAGNAGVLAAAEFRARREDRDCWTRPRGGLQRGSPTGPAFHEPRASRHSRLVSDAATPAERGGLDDSCRLEFAKVGARAVAAGTPPPATCGPRPRPSDSQAGNSTRLRGHDRCARRTVYSVARASSAPPADSAVSAGSVGVTRIGNTTTAISSPTAKIPADHQNAVVYPWTWAAAWRPSTPRGCARKRRPSWRTGC